MDPTRFDALARRLAPTTSRRDALRLLTVGALGLLAGLPGRGAAAAACLKDGKECKRGGQCCSGRCAGKRGKKTCRRAPGQANCTIDRNVCKVGQSGVGCKGSGGCACAVTTRGTAFCASLFTDVCARCDSGADCVALGFPQGSACIRVGGQCEDCAAEGGTKCVTRCPN